MEVTPEDDPAVQRISANYATWHASGAALAFVDSASGGVKVWFKESGRLIKLPHVRAASPGALYLPRNIAWRPDQLVLAVGGSDGSITLWNDLTASSLTKFTLRAAGDPVLVLAWSPDGGTVAAVSSSDKGRIDLWNPDIGALRGNLADAALGPITDLAWRPGENILAAVSESGKIHLWNTDTDASLAVFGQESSSENNRLAWSPDGTRLASAYTASVIRFDGAFDTAGRVVIWDNIGHAVRTLTGRTDAVLGLAWHPDSRRLVTHNRIDEPDASSVGRILVWDTVTGQQITALQPPNTSNLLGMAWEPSGQALTIWSWWEGIMQAPEAYTGEICSWLNRNLGYQDWRRLAGARLYRPACPNLPRPAALNPLADRDEDLLLEWATTLEGGLMLAGLGVLLLGVLGLVIRRIVRWVREQRRLRQA